jgi:ParB-like chromosome segregation protein Spo0J
MNETETETTEDTEAEAPPANGKAKKSKGDGNSKKAFDAGRNTMWSFDPLELCIVGGKCLPKEEQGPLDTAVDENDSLWDPRLYEALAEEFCANVATFGVDTPILVVKRDGVPVVVAGRRRVRAARRANHQRKKHGEPLMKVDAKQKRDTDAGLLGTLIQENEGRHDDDLLSKLAKAKRLMNAGVSPEDVALRFQVSLAHFKTWLAFDDNALTATKKAVEAGKISPSTAITLARIKEPEKQKEALDSVLEHVAQGGKSSPRVAKNAAKEKGHKGKAGVTDKRTLAKLLLAVQNTPHPHNSSEKTLAWWTGVEDALSLVLGEDDVDEKLTKVLDDVYAAIKADLKAKAKK